METGTLFDLLSVPDLQSIPVTECSEDAYSQAAIEAMQNVISNRPVDTIVPCHLYLGSQLQARNTVLLTSLGITDVIVMSGIDSDTPFKSKIRFWRIDIPDCLGYSIMAHLRAGLHTIENHIVPSDCLPSKFDLSEHLEKPFRASNHKSIFIHCQQGISRSTTLVILYLMYRLFCSLPSEACAADMPSPGFLIAKVRAKRQVCPNVSFRVQLEFLNQCLKALLTRDKPSDHTQYEGGKGLLEIRKSQFDTALCLAEIYLETRCRCIGETLAYLRHSVLDPLRSKANKLAQLGLSAWTLKKSPARNPNEWLEFGLLLENFRLYAQQPISFCLIICMNACRPSAAVQDVGECQRLLEEKFFDAVKHKVRQRWRNNQNASFTKLPMLFQTQSVAPQHRDMVITANSPKLLSAHFTPDIKAYQLPKNLLFAMITEEEKEKWIISALKGGNEPLYVDEEEHWDTHLLLSGLARACAETSQVLASLTVSKDSDCSAGLSGAFYMQKLGNVDTVQNLKNLSASRRIIYSL